VAAGSAFGELALGGAGVLTSRVVAAEATECELLSVEALEMLRRHHPAISDAIFHALTRSLSARLQRATQEIQMLEG
jgi:CRP-like cAMP-binding protein